MSGAADSAAGELLDELTHLFGPDRVLQGSAAAPHLSCTSGAQRRVPGIVFPCSEEDVIAVVRAAAKRRVALYPISTGNNWGYGSANPVRDDCVVVCLARMDRILHFDADTGVVQLEPGVTQGKLAAFLAAGGHPYMVPTTGAGPQGSILGNALERGYGITPACDHFGALMGVQAVLPDASVYRSPLASLGAPALDAVFKWGIGPYVDGLFAQGAFGVVTRGTIALSRRPERVEAFVFRLEQDSLLEGAVERVRDTLTALPGAVAGINLMNARRVLAMSAPFPRDHLGADGLIPRQVLDRMCRQYQVPSWTGFGTLYGTSRIVSAARRDIRSRLRPVASRLLFLSPGFTRGVRRAVSAVPPLERRLGPLLHTLQSSLDLIGGTPNQTALPLAYWKRTLPFDRCTAGSEPQPEARALNPARDGCGLLWYAPLVEMKAARVRSYVDLVTRLVPKFGMEPLITLTSLSERCFGSTVPVLFERDSVSQLELARQCHVALMEAGRREGFLPYRIGVQSMDWLLQQAPAHWALVARLKSAIDPSDIVSPGRYAPPSAREDCG
jgi:FAD/FMN-containing dehydrogenase